jgi:beta-lactamase superfamily II metal-dependent hydrolase
MPKKKETRERKPPALTKTGSAGYALNKADGIRKPLGKSSLDESRLLEQEEVAAALRRAEEKAPDLRNAAPASVVPGERGDGVFRISFIQMGKGDCTIMCTPGGKVIMIDCGSSDREEDQAAFTARVKGVLQSTAYLRNTTTIDIVILTHGDKDHWGQLSTILKGFALPTVYHSGYIGDYGGANRWLQRNADSVKSVILSKDGDIGENTLAGQPILPVQEGVSMDERLDADVGLVVVAEAETNFRVTLLAASVSHAYVQDDDAQDLKNRGSIVTLIEVSGKKFLISGDATKATEAFLLRSPTRAARIANVDVVQVGHHGSDLTSSSQNWVNQLRPVERVIVSTTKVGPSGYSLPRAPVIRRYLQRFVTNGRPADPASHPISTWDLTQSTTAPIELAADQPVYSTGSSGTQTITIP